MRAKTLTCSEARLSETIVTGVKKDIIIGGQDVFVKLSSSGTAYDGGTNIFSSNVNVQNLLKYEMGTADGSTVRIEIFFSSGPTVTSGSGVVSLANPDGVGTFTAPNQPYFHYGEILTPFELSQARQWQFNVPSTVNTFLVSGLRVVADRRERAKPAARGYLDGIDEQRLGKSGELV